MQASGKGKGKRDCVEGLELDRCPACYVTSGSEWLIALYFRSRFADYPAVLFGPDVAKWPAWWLDAMSAITAAKSAADAIEFKV